MKRNLHVELIKHYILESRNKSFEEVEAFADEIGASFDELEAAIYEIAENLPTHPSHETEHHLMESAHSKNSKRKRITGKTVHILLRFRHVTFLALAVFLSTAITLQIIRFSDSQQNLPQAARTLAEGVTHIEAPPVYANQEEISADEVFSFPEVPVTLRYTNKPKRDVVGFFPYWMLAKHEQVNIQGYTHVNIFALEVDGKGNIMTTTGGEKDLGWDMWNDPKLDTFLSRLKKGKVKRLLTIKAFNNSNIEALSTSDEAQERFISNALQLINSKDLDGINIDFEYIGTADPQVKQGFIRLMANLRQAMEQNHKESQLTICTYITSATNDKFFDVTALATHSDALIIMGYDIHTPKGSPGPVAPFEGPGGIIGYMESYLQRVDPEKLVLAVPYYGYDWPVDTGEPGDIHSYAQLADMSKRFQVQWNNSTQTPFMQYVDENQKSRIVHFENSRSLGLKYDYINQKELLGVGIWAMGYEGLNQDLEKLLYQKFGAENF